MIKKLLVFSEDVEKLTDFLPETVDIHSSTLNKTAKNLFKSLNPLVVIIDLNGSQVKDVIKLIKYIKHSCQSICYLMVVSDDNNLGDIWRSGCDEIISYSCVDQATKYKLTNITELMALANKQLQQKKSEADLLISVNHFSKFRQPLSDLIRDFASNLSVFCHSFFTFIYKPDGKNIGSWKALNGAENQSLQEGFDKLLAELLVNSDKSQPDINLLADNEKQKQLTQVIKQQPEAILCFPLRVYNQGLYTVVCFINEENMANVSVQQIDIMKEAASQLTILLERRVAESRLKAQYQRLKDTLGQLQQTKEQLVHSEKMAAVGKLAAGIAHEINNPLSYVLSNMEPLDDYLNTMVKLLGMHDQLLQDLDESIEGNTKELKNKIETEQQQADLEFVLEDIHAIVVNSKDGLLRVRDIISDLKSFSHQQNLEKQSFNLLTMVNESLRLLKYDTPDSISIHVEIEDNLLVHSHRGFIQQIVTNLIKNAVFALTDSGERNAEVRVTAVLSNQQVLVQVGDNGPGIPEEIKKSIFNPFFTTKKIGQGTGLGLSVSYNLAKKLEGNLEVQSKPGGTIFTLSLPALDESKD